MGFHGRTCFGAIIDWPESGPYHIDLLRGMDAEARRLDLDLIVLATRGAHPDDTPEANPGSLVFDFLEAPFLDGLAILSGQEWIERKGGASGKPKISLAKPMAGVLSILTDARPGFEALLEHLFSLHRYRNPVFAGGPPGVPDADERRSLFEAALTRYGISEAKRRVFEGRFLIDDGEALVRHFYDVEGMKPDVIVCANDGMAIGVRQALYRRGILSPESVAITGYDDMPVSRWYEGPFTTVRQPVETAGQEAVRLLALMIKGERIDRAPRSLPTTLVVRSSCGCAQPSLRLPLHGEGNLSAVNLPDDRVAKFLLEHESLENIVSMDHERFTDSCVTAFNREYIRDWRLSGHPDKEQAILARLRVNDFFVTNFEPEEKSQARQEPYPARARSRLMIAWQGGQRTALPPEGLPFPTSSFLPDTAFPAARSTLVVEGLGEGEDVFGYLVAGYGAYGNNSYEALRQRLTESMKAVAVAGRLKEFNVKLESARMKLEELSLTDELTHQHNRRGFVSLASQQIAYCRRHEEGFWIFFVDLDGLKAINDGWGHQAGDEAIAAMAAVLKRTFRVSDIVARLGGDEFAIMASDAPQGIMGKLGARLEGFIQDANAALAKPWRLGMSMGGFYSGKGCTDSLEAMMEAADSRLYEAKRAKKASGGGRPLDDNDIQMM